MTFGTYTESSAISCNTSYKQEITPETLVGILSGEISSEGWQAHLETFFNELPKPYILGVMKENDLSMEQLKKIFETLPEVFQEKNFKEICQDG